MYIVADIGGTKMRMARSADLIELDEPIVQYTPAPEDIVAAIVGTARSLAGGAPIKAIMIGTPSYMHFAEALRKAADTTVYFENDTALCGLGEAHYGAGKGSSIFVYVTISTGVGGVRIVHGRIDASAQGFEIGGQYLSIDNKTTLEDLISGRAVEKHYGVHPKELGKEHPIWEEEARILAYGLHNTILHWSPDRIALGGSMMNEIGIPIDRVRFHLEQIKNKFQTLPELVHSQLGDKGGLMGALARLKQRHQ